VVNVLVAAAGLPEDLREHFRCELADCPQLELHFVDTGDEPALIEAARQAEVVVAWRLPETAVSALDSLRLWIFPGAGVQSLIEPIKRMNETRPVTLVNSHGNAPAVATHAVALLLALINRVVLHHNWMATGRWRTGEDDAKTIPMAGKCVGLLGYGAINRHVEQFLSGFDVHFAALRNHWPAELGAVTPSTSESPRPSDRLQHYTPDQLAAFLDATDILCIALPATPTTRGLIGAVQLQQLGAQGVLVNVARGAIVQEDALYAALRDGVIAGAALDVWYNYDPTPDADGRRYPCGQPFHELQNVVLSPHRAASPFAALERWSDVLDNLRRYAAGDALLNVIDLSRGY
jgi:phosphoglycerate dehydrogenase-like enzyme